MASTVFSASGEDIINKCLSPSSSTSLYPKSSADHCHADHPEETLDQAYEIQRCVQWIHKLGVSKVALQFPDELLVDAPDVALAIEMKSGTEIYILGDTSYGSCCIDEVTAEHVGADSLIHFGRACLTHHNRRLPVLYIYENLPVDKDAFLTAFSKTFKENNKVLVICDLRYQQSLENLFNSLQFHPNVVLMELDIPQDQEVNSSNKGNLAVCGRKCTLPVDSFLMEQWVGLYVGEEGFNLSNLMLTLNRCTFYSYNPKSHSLRAETMNVNQQLMKRFFLIEKAKDALMIGILVATLGVANYLDIIERIKKMITAAGKKYYTFIVGKLNPAKLANFPEIDIYTLIACPENSLLDSRDFYRPIITPFELEVALNSARQWTGDYTTDFRQLLPGASHYIELESHKMEPDVSLVSGRMRTLGFEQEIQQDQVPIAGQQLNTRHSSNSVSVLTSGSDFLSQRSWQGLQPRVGETPVTAAQPGRRGLAARYEEEGNGPSTTSETRGKPDGEE